MKKILIWLSGLIVVFGLIASYIFLPVNIYDKWFYALVLGSLIAVLRLWTGPTVIDRVASLKVLSVLVVSFCGIASVISGSDIYMDIALAWSFQAFIATIVFAKYIGGRNLDD